MNLMHRLAGWKRINRITAEAIIAELQKSSNYAINTDEIPEGIDPEKHHVLRTFYRDKKSDAGRKVTVRKECLHGSWDYGSEYHINQIGTIPAKTLDYILS